MTIDMEFPGHGEKGQKLQRTVLKDMMMEMLREKSKASPFLLHNLFKG